MRANLPKVGLSAMSLYLPSPRVDLSQWCQWTGQSPAKISAVIGRSFRMPAPDESVYTMAATAVLRLILERDLDASEIGYLVLATESGNDNAVGAPIVKGMVNDALRSMGRTPLNRHAEAYEVKQACLAGIYALKSALRWAAFDGAGGRAIVVSADIAEYERGSTGEPTQGAGAVAMLVERDPKLLEIDLSLSGSASDYRGVDFRKPMRRYAVDGYASNTKRTHDFPVFSGQYSTICYLEQTLWATQHLMAKVGDSVQTMFARSAAIFMHRPYHRMPETALAGIYLWGLGLSEDPQERGRFTEFCKQADVEPGDVLDELRSSTPLWVQAQEVSSVQSLYPMTMRVSKAFRSTEIFQEEVLPKLSTGAETMMDFGNLYSAALPAWLAVGLEEAARTGQDWDDRELLLIGYGSGDTAEAMLVRVVPGWQEAAEAIGVERALIDPIDLSQQDYETLHDTHHFSHDEKRPQGSFRIDRVGGSAEGDFQDLGIEYYRYRPSGC